MSFAASGIGPPRWLTDRSQRRMAKLVQVNWPQINDSSVRQRWCAEGHFRKHTSFNLELDGLQQQRAVPLSTPVSKEQENEATRAITRTGRLRRRGIKHNVRNPRFVMWHTGDSQRRGRGLHGHSVCFFYWNGHTQQDKMLFHMHRSLQDCFRKATVDLSFPPVAWAPFVSQPNRAPLGCCAMCW